MSSVPVDDDDPRRWALSVADDVARDLADPASQAALDLQPCGDSLLQPLMILAQHHEKREEWATALALIVSRAHTQMLNFPYRSVPVCWRRLYSEASLLWSLFDLAYITDHSALIWEAAIARLDYAIVIAGAPGDGRLDLIHDTIQRIQDAYIPFPKFRSIQMRSTLLPEVLRLLSASQPVPELPNPPSMSAFVTHYASSPFVLRNFASDWPALTHLNDWSSKEYLLRVGGLGRAVPVEIGRDYRDEEWVTKMMSWGIFLDHLFSYENVPPQNLVYLAQHDLFKQFPDLRSDIIVPDYVYAALSPPSHFPQYTPPNNPEAFILNAWIGPQGATSPAHTDPYFNIYTQAAGRKTVWIAPPHCSSVMSLSEHATEDDDTAPTTNLLSNTSTIDVFTASCTSPRDSLFREKVIPYAMTTILNPGDSLFMPPGWWHAMRCDDMSASVSMWF